MVCGGDFAGYGFFPFVAVFVDAEQVRGGVLEIAEFPVQCHGFEFSAVCPCGYHGVVRFRDVFVDIFGYFCTCSAEVYGEPVLQIAFPTVIGSVTSCCS